MPKSAAALSQAVDQKVYDLLHELLQEQTEQNRAGAPGLPELLLHIALARDLRALDVMLYVQSHDALLRRTKRAVLERSVDVVLRMCRQDEAEELAEVIRVQHEHAMQRAAELGADPEAGSRLMDVVDSNDLNRLVVAMWGRSGSGRAGDNVVGDSAVGDSVVGDSAAGDSVVGDSAAGDSAAGDKLVGAADHPLGGHKSGHENPALGKPHQTSHETPAHPEARKRARDAKAPGKTKKPKVEHCTPSTTLAALGGLQAVTTQLMELVGLPILHPEIYVATGVEPPRGILLYGPPGCGKTTIAHALAGELCVPFISVSAPSVVSGMSGESEKKLRDIFEEARALAPCIVFLDEIDAITPKRDGGAQREMERRIVAQLLTSMDELTLSNTGGKPVVVVGATNRPDALDSALRRAGRFDREILLNVPDEAQRCAILRTMTAGLKLQAGDAFNYWELAKMTPGFVGADLKSLVTAAGIAAIKRIFEGMSEEEAGARGAAVAGGDVHSGAVSNLDAELGAMPGRGTQSGAMPGRGIHPGAMPGRDTQSGAMPNQDTQSGAMPNQDTHPGAMPNQDTHPGAMPNDDPHPETTPNDDPHPETTPNDDPHPEAMDVDTPPDVLHVFQRQPQQQQLSTIQRFLARHPGPLSAAQLAPLSITYQDFKTALPTVQPTAKREGFATVPDVTWKHVGALARVRMELHMCVVQPIKKPELYQKVGISAPAGVLMWGPPGCGKTLLAKAVANESRANFISVKGPELLNKYVGESERAVRQVFLRARALAPCIIFFDELDALVPRRTASLSESSARVVNTLLTELDGLNDRLGIFVVGATNRPDMIDPAMLRPGRLDKTLYIELPDADERLEILRTLTAANHTPLAPDVDLRAVAADARCRNFSGADLSLLVREAGVSALKKKFFFGQQVQELDDLGFYVDNASDDHIVVTAADFLAALLTITPSVSDKDRARYERLNLRLGWGVIHEDKKDGPDALQAL